MLNVSSVDHQQV